MPTDKSDELATVLAAEASKWLRKPFMTNCYVLVDMTIFTVVIIAAIVTQIWWLLIPVLLLAQCCGLFFISIVSEALQQKDAEIQSLRQKLEAV